MDAITAIRDALQMSERVGMAYLADLTDQELMMRPHPACHHVNWQVGHLISSEHQLMRSVAAEKMPPLPDGFAEKYTKETASSNDASRFATKEELMSAYKAQRAATLQILESSSAEDLDSPSGISYAPTKGALFAMQASHWLMHCGQWVIVRRQAGKPIAI